MKKTFLFLISFSAVTASAYFFSQQQDFTQNECPFCKENILKNQAFYESEHVLGILTHKPAVEGHVLVIPKRHVERLEQLSDVEWSEILKAIRKIDLAEKKLWGNEAYLLLQKNGKAAGQSVSHVHFHYLPRFESDSYLLFVFRFFFTPFFPPQSTEQLHQSADKLAVAIQEI